LSKAKPAAQRDTIYYIQQQSKYQHPKVKIMKQFLETFLVQPQNSSNVVNIPDLVVDEVHDLGVVDDIPDLFIDDVPDLVVDDIPDLVVDDIPDLVVDDIPNLVVDDIPDLVVDDIPDLVVDDIPDLVVDDIPDLVVDDVPELHGGED
jgi:hypothetical protein